MKFNTSTKHFLLPLFIIAICGFFSAVTVSAQPNISVNGHLSQSKVKRGRTVKAIIVMEIPRGYHVHSNRPLEKFLIATKLEVEAPNGIRVGPVTYPRALLRKLKFSKNNVAVYEGRVVMGFGVNVPGNYATGSSEIKAKLRYQSCDDEVCFPPLTREVKLWINVE